MSCRIALAALLVACGGQAGDSDTAPPPLARTVHLGIEHSVVEPGAEPPVSKVSLVLTDETGAARREPIGEFVGGCTDVSARARNEPMEPVLGVDCWWAGAGVKIRVVLRRNLVNVLRAEVDEISGAESFEPIRTIEIPVGTAIRTDRDDTGPPGGG